MFLLFAVISPSIIFNSKHIYKKCEHCRSYKSILFSGITCSMSCIKCNGVSCLNQQQPDDTDIDDDEEDDDDIPEEIIWSDIIQI